MILVKLIKHIIVCHQRSLVIPVGVLLEVQNLVLLFKHAEQVAVIYPAVADLSAQQIAIMRIGCGQRIIVRHIFGIQSVFIRCDGKEEACALTLDIFLRQLHVMHYAAYLSFRQRIAAEVIVERRGIIQPIVIADGNGIEVGGLKCSRHYLGVKRDRLRTKSKVFFKPIACLRQIVDVEAAVICIQRRKIRDGLVADRLVSRMKDHPDGWDQAQDQTGNDEKQP